jgi:2-polyprenyl-3-methyl-5-hydroxy-6-metoxy-1,4-benzoquinol methylase
MEPAECAVCRASAANAAIEVARGLDFEYDTSDDTFSMVECQTCRTIYLNPRPTAGELARIYPHNYYSYNYSSRVNPLAIKIKDFLDKSKSKGWLKFCRTDNPRFLDIGCGNGRNLEILEKLGLSRQNLYGLEINNETVDKLKEQGFNAFLGAAEEAALQLKNEEPFDLIVILQVLEHVKDPDLVMKSLAHLLKPQAVLVVETPNVDSLDCNLFKKRYWGGYHFPRHWYLFNKESLAKLGAKAGLQVISVKYLPAQTFWIYSLHHIVKEKFSPKLAGALFDPFRNLFLLSVFTAFDILRAKLGFSTSNIQVVFQKSQS